MSDYIEYYIGREARIVFSPTTKRYHLEKLRANIWLVSKDTYKTENDAEYIYLHGQPPVAWRRPNPGEQDAYHDDVF